jgi:chromosome segregation ATPase
VKISRIEIADTYGTKQFKAPPFSVLRITGSNGSGKSSILRALGYLFGGGTDPSVIRKGAEQSIVSMTLDDGTVITKTTRPKRARKGGEVTGYTVDLEVTQPDGTPRPAPQSFINELGSAMAVDPSALLRIDASTVPGRRALSAELLKLVPVSFTPAEVARACMFRSSPEIPLGEMDAIAIEHPADPQTLDDLKKLVASITEQRRRVGQIQSDTEGAINRLRAALPESAAPIVDQHMASKAAGADEKAMRKDLDDAEEFRRAVESAIAEAKQEIEAEKAEALRGADLQAANEETEINRECDGELLELEREFARRKAAIEAKRAEKKQESARQLQQKREQVAQIIARKLKDLDDESQPQLQKAIEQVTQAKDRIAAHARAATLREEIEIQLAAKRDATWKYDELSEVLKRLESLRLEKLQHLPVAGLVVEDGTPYLDGIEWQNVNLARRVEAVLQICTQQTGKLPLILWDDSEHADSDMHEAIEAGLVEAGYQVIEARVSDGPLTIEAVKAA